MRRQPESPWREGPAGPVILKLNAEQPSLVLNADQPSLESLTARLSVMIGFDRPRFAWENEALIKAKRVFLSDDSAAAQLPSALERESSSYSRGGYQMRVSASGKIAKRKSRASKRAPTTYISADPANFRRMVQEVTGIRLVESDMPVGPVVPAESPQGCGLGGVDNRFPPQFQRPMLDTSALLLDLYGPATGNCLFNSVEDGSVFQFEPLPSFHILDTWRESDF
ncbi:hypothetical protein HPP92_028709 [Vanilla planifolia]|uniref:VQ domain-containing protein n=1 Tax=Vanilla planifolia TaxID=51239 RepID=A0A835U2R5_VANPL|nr:hypothetical protein HPP92_028709 [Vanilla planifolia]